MTAGQHGPIDHSSHLDSRRAWFIAVAASAANFITFGILFSFGVFLTPLAEAFDTSTGPIAPLFSCAVGCYYFAGALGGSLADRHGIQPVIRVGLISLVVGLGVAAVARDLWVLYLVYAPLVGFGVGCCYPPLIGLVGRWFEQRRSMAMAILLAGVGGGTLVVPAAAAVVVSDHGWRVAFASMAVVSAVVVGLAALVCKDPPGTRPVDRAGVGTAIRSAGFRRLYLSVVLIGPGFFAPFAFLNDYAVAEGVGARAASLLVGIIGGSSVVARIGFGTLGDRLGGLRQYRLGFVAIMGSLSCWLVAGGSYGAMVASAVLLGLGWAAWVTATPIVLADWFGVRSLGGVIGSLYTGLGIGGLAGPAVSGFVIDAVGFRPAIALAVASTVAACGLVFLPIHQNAVSEPVPSNR